MSRFVLSSSKGLAEVTRSENETVQFIHESVRDFLIKDNGLRDLWHELGEDFESSSHDRLKQCCLAYVKIDKSKSLPGGSPPSSETLPKPFSKESKALRESVSARFPFLEYAVQQVFYHANEAAAGLKQSTFLEHFPLEAWINLDNLFERDEYRRRTPSATFLYLFAERSWTRLIATQLNRDPRTDLYGELYNFPLFAAIARGHRNAAEVILQRGMSSATGNFVHLQLKSTQHGIVCPPETLISWAVHKTDEGIAKLLLDTGKVDVNEEGHGGKTALHWAASTGHVCIFRRLLDTGLVDVNQKDFDGNTPLSYAAKGGHKGIVRLLLDTGKVDVNSKDRQGNTALILAVRTWHEIIVRLLVDTGRVDINVKDKSNATPLLWATIDGYEGILRLLLDTGKVHIDIKDDSGRIPLSWAAQSGDEGIVKLLLNTGGVNGDMKDGDRQALLFWAAENCYKKIVQLLLDTNRVDPDAKDEDGQTPLLLAVQAAQNPPTEVVEHPRGVSIKEPSYAEYYMKCLLEREQGPARVRIAQEEMRHDDIVQLLLSTDRVDPDAKDKNGRTPLSWAAQIGHEKIVQLLLDTDQVDPDTEDKDGLTPLSWAAQNGHERTLELLRKHSCLPTHTTPSVSLSL